MSRPGPESLSPLFEPQRVAVVGASPDFSRFGGRVMHFLKAFGFAGTIWPVNPKYDAMADLPCFPSLAALPGRPDHVGIVVAADHVLGVLEECVAVGARAATVFSAGFAEQGTASGRALQERITAFARAHGIRVLGPNCNGVINWKRHFTMGATATVLEANARPGPVGVVSQSGGLGQVNVMWRAIRAGLGISYQASCGNEADVDVLDVAEFLIADPETRVILMALEAIRDGDRLKSIAARALDVGKPIVMLKIGRSAAGRRAAESHTGAMTGEDAVHDAALDQLGLLRVDDAQHLYEAALLLQQGRRANGAGLTSMSTSGGGLAHLADRAEHFGLHFPAYSQETLSALSEVIPAFINLGNPTDLSVDLMGQPERLNRVIEATVADPAVAIALPMLTTVPMRDRDLFFDFARRAAKPAAILWTGGCTDGPFPESDGLVDGVPVYRNIDSALRAVSLLVRHHANVDRQRSRPALQRPAGMDAALARSVVREAPDRILGERESKRVLAAHGIATTREVLARSAAEAVEHFRSFRGPVALKIAATGISHKSDVGGVRLDLHDDTQVATAFAAITAAVRAARPDIAISGVLVQEMVAPGVELILGSSRDTTYGPVLALGIGGVLAEYGVPPVLRLPPLDHAEARSMIDALPYRRVLDGVRGRSPVAVEALIETLVRFSWLVSDLADVVGEIDVNPLIVGDRAVAADGLMVRR
ncbi:MAG: acetate--CoA ligase family protein [Alphaproteobacteria bacterium]|nr:acetate--CoA ligase family protein [Alphaproteobacteria bacterium]